MKKSIVNGENRGSINEILLKALQTGDKYGYEINKEIEVKSKGKYFIKEASLYSGLKRLESAGFITSYWKDGNLGIRRHYYSISEKGLEKLNNSNFSWDNSKEELMSDLFKSNNPKQMQMNIDNNFESTQNKPTNPFAYVVNENQQDMFSLFNNEQKPVIKNEKVEEQKSDENNIKEQENINKDETKNEEKINQSNKYEELKKEVQFKNSYLNNKKNVNNINIFDYIQNSEQNASIIFEKNKKEEKIESTSIVEQEEKKEDKVILDEVKENENLISNNLNSPTNFEKENTYDDSSKDKLKDIFKNLMVDEVEKEIEIQETEIKVEEDNIEQIINQKPELPRIKLENDVNVTLQTGKSENKSYVSTYAPTPQSKNIPSVKQYLSKTKSLNLSNKKIEEDISLHGFKIREYSKMNSRNYKTSNYYYPNIMNLVLFSIVGGLCLLECILGLIYASSSVVGIIVFVLGIAISLLFLGSAIVKYNNDKYKVEIKNYNFKTTLFYFVMIFIVLTIIFVCVNILRGMNLNNFASFAKLMIFELLISFNLVIYPIIKLILFKNRKFNN